MKFIVTFGTGRKPCLPICKNNRDLRLQIAVNNSTILYSGVDRKMPFYRILLVTRNDLAVASIYNKFVETAKYVINNGGVFQRIYNTGNQLFRYVYRSFGVIILDIRFIAGLTPKHITRGLSFLFNFVVPPRLWRKYATV